MPSSRCLDSLACYVMCMSFCCLQTLTTVQGGPEGLDAEKLLGDNEPLKEEEDMWFHQQNRPVNTCL